MGNVSSKWNGRNVLVIGDSITADGRWQARLAELTGCRVRTHAYGGIGLIDMLEGLGASENGMKYDPHTGCNGNFGPLSAEDAAWAELIIIDGPYNERHLEYGERGDTYPEKNTLRGKFAYVIERLYAMLEETGNYDCHIMLATPHCTGKYDWIDRDGYEDFPIGSGRSLESMAELIEKIGAEYHLTVCNTWKHSGIGRLNWRHYCNSAVAEAENYDPQAEHDAPYPMYADQVHLNAEGYARLGECIAAWAELA